MACGWTPYRIRPNSKPNIGQLRKQKQEQNQGYCQQHIRCEARIARKNSRPPPSLGPQSLRKGVRTTTQSSHPASRHISVTLVTEQVVPMAVLRGHWTIPTSVTRHRWRRISCILRRKDRGELGNALVAAMDGGQKG